MAIRIEPRKERIIVQVRTGPVPSVLVRRCRPNNRKEKMNFSADVFLMKASSHWTSRQPISSEIIESQIPIGPSKNTFYNKSKKNFTYLIGQALW